MIKWTVGGFKLQHHISLENIFGMKCSKDGEDVVENVWFVSPFYY